jgi:hypothetical protein
VAKNDQLDVPVQIVGGAGEQLDHLAQQQIHEAKRTDRTSHEKRGQYYEALAAATIRSLLCPSGFPPRRWHGDDSVVAGDARHD